MEPASAKPSPPIYWGNPHSIRKDLLLMLCSFREGVGSGPSPRSVGADAGALFSRKGDRHRRGDFRIGGANVFFRESFNAFL